MKLELFVFGITLFFIVNTYHDGKYLKIIMTWKKYYTMAMYAFIGFSIYLLIRRNPKDTHLLCKSASNIIKYMPIDKNSKDFMTPIFDMTNNNVFSNSYNDNMDITNQPQFKRMMNSGSNNNHKRSVSETKKKYIASQQDWTCNECNEQLTAWFEVDHKIRLDQGGTNNVDNLVALCRNCHGKKTAFENM